jgi:hypothetical protein
MLNVEYEKDMGESASEALVYTLNQIALEIAGDESLRAHILGQKPLVADQPQEKQELTSTPETAPIAKASHQSQEKPKLASIPKDAPITRVGLRREPRMITNDSEITSMLAEYNFFDLTKNPHGSFRNDFVDNNDGTVTDRATGLMWEKNGSSFLSNRRAKKYIEQLNSRRFAGYYDWRMPTVEELASLLARKRDSGVHLNPVFDRKQSRCWTADKGESKSWSWYKGAWLIDFKNGQVNEAYWRGEKGGSYSKNPENHVKAVRSDR